MSARRIHDLLDRADWARRHRRPHVLLAVAEAGSRSGMPEVDVRLLRAQALRGLDRLEAAGKEVAKGLAVEPGLFGLLEEQALQLYLRGKYDDARASAHQLRERDPTSAIAAKVLSGATRQLSKPASELLTARDVVDAALVRHPGDPLLRGERTALLQALGHPEAALAEALAVLGDDPGNETALGVLSQVAFLGDPSQLAHTRTLARAALARDPQSTAALESELLVAATLGEWAEAMRLARRTAKRRSKDEAIGLWLHIAFLGLAGGQETAADAALEPVRALPPDDPRLLERELQLIGRRARWHEVDEAVQRVVAWCRSPETSCGKRCCSWSPCAGTTMPETSCAGAHRMGPALRAQSTSM